MQFRKELFPILTELPSTAVVRELQPENALSLTAVADGRLTVSRDSRPLRRSVLRVTRFVNEMFLTDVYWNISRSKSFMEDDSTVFRPLKSLKIYLPAVWYPSMTAFSTSPLKNISYHMVWALLDV